MIATEAGMNPIDVLASVNRAGVRSLRAERPST
jgi:hypothetical protein